jgi:hypothetical protein
MAFGMSTRFRLSGAMPLWILLAVDGLLIAAHVFVVGNEKSVFPLRFDVDTATRDFFSLTRDRSLSEWWEYTKTGLSAVAFGVAAKRRRTAFYAVLAGLLALATVDNAMGLHEAVGGWTGSALGDLSFFAAVGLASLALLVWCWPRDSVESKNSFIALKLLMLLAAFVALSDYLTATVTHVIPKTSAVGGLIEDGGELVSISLLLALALALGFSGTARDRILL